MSPAQRPTGGRAVRGSSERVGRLGFVAPVASDWRDIDDSATRERRAGTCAMTGSNGDSNEPAPKPAVPPTVIDGPDQPPAPDDEAPAQPGQLSPEASAGKTLPGEPPLLDPIPQSPALATPGTLPGPPAAAAQPYAAPGAMHPPALGPPLAAPPVPAYGAARPLPPGHLPEAPRSGRGGLLALMIIALLAGMLLVTGSLAAWLFLQQKQETEPAKTPSVARPAAEVKPQVSVPSEVSTTPPAATATTPPRRPSRPKPRPQPSSTAASTKTAATASAKPPPSSSAKPPKRRQRRRR